MPIIEGEDSLSVSSTSNLTHSIPFPQQREGERVLGALPLFSLSLPSSFYFILYIYLCVREERDFIQRRADTFLCVSFPFVCRSHCAVRFYKEEEELVFSVARVNTFRTPTVPSDPPVSLLTPKEDPLHPTLFGVPGFWKSEKVIQSLWNRNRGVVWTARGVCSFFFNYFVLSPIID